MAEPLQPVKVKLFSGFIYSDIKVLNDCVNILRDAYGQADFISDEFSFAHTDYYSEMGNSLLKRFISFEQLVKREDLPAVKLFTNSLENRFSENGIRIINIDPGYLTMSNVFLASCKDYYHRIYISDGVYMENELRFTQGRYIPFEWTYPDYQKEEYLNFFRITRNKYSDQLKLENKKKDAV
ncbi:MAG: DUF4416 family protein [Spirochaetes bacterium]|nr:DUF4416 family protein [Spirochaetota bacterium]